MNDIVEKFLLKKLDEEIEGAGKAVEKWGLKSRCNKLISIHEECREMSLMLKNKPATSAAVKETRREKLYYLLNLIEEWHELLKNQPRALLSVDEIPRKLKQVRKEVEDATDSHSEQPSSPKDPQVYRWSCHAMSLAETRGFEDQLMIMERLLLNKGSKAIGIVGVAGVGKTALCQQAYNYQPVQEHFLLRIWLCLSKHQKGMAELSCEDQLKMMLSCLGFEDHIIQKVAEEKLLQLAVRRLLNRGRYLIVLDDVWTVKDNGKVVVEKEIQNLFSFLTDPHLSRYEGAIIASSRSPELEQMVGAKNMHRLLPLADVESCWDIFTDAFKEDGTQLPQELEKLKGNILDNCAGLPLMAKMLGKIAHREP